MIDDLTLLDGQNDERRWHWAIVGISALLEDFCLGLQERAEMMRRMSRGLEREMHIDGVHRDRLNQRLRELRGTVRTLLDGPYDGALSGVITTRTSANRSSVDAIASARADESLTSPFTDIVGSVIHMFVNRLMRSDARAHEMLLYGLLAQHYETAQRRRAQPSVVTSIEGNS